MDIMVFIFGFFAGEMTMGIIVAIAIYYWRKVGYGVFGRDPMRKSK